MDKDTISAALGGGQAVERLLEGWSHSQASMPADGQVFFLDPSYVAEAGEEAALDADLTAALVTAARRADAGPAARALAWHVYHRLKERPEWGPGGPGGWPTPTALVGESAPLFYLLALLGDLPALREIHRAHAVPRAIHQATLCDIQRWADHYRRAEGVWGMDARHLPWYWLHLHGELYEVGRLQYEPGPWQLPVRVYRHAVTGAVVALSDEGVRYRADGQRDGAGGVEDPAGAWTAHLVVGAEEITGHRILPVGQAEREITRLARAEWPEALAPGAPVLHLHIPQGAPLEMEACRHSLQEALRFFSTHFPEQPVVAFACHSWLLDAQLEEALPPTSNLVRFLRQMYLLPVADNGGGAFFFTFGQAPTDLSQLPRDTTLRRALIDHVLRGGHWRGGACFLLPQDLPAWGTDIYRSAPHSLAFGRR